MKNKRILISLACLFVALAAVFAVIKLSGNSDKDKVSSSGTSSVSAVSDEKAQKSIAITVIFKDKSKKEYTVKTDGEFLADALLKAGIIQSVSDDGMYTEIAGERADYTADKAWWCVTKDGAMTTEGINTQKIADGDRFEITNTPA